MSSGEEEELSEEFGFHCQICSKQGQLHDQFKDLLEEIDYILHHDIPDEVSWASGGLGAGKIEYHFEELSLHVFFDRYGEHPITHKVENKALSRKWIDGLRIQLREQWNTLCAQKVSISEVLVLVLSMLEQTTVYLDAYHYPDSDKKLHDLEEKEETGPLVDVDNVQDIISHLTGVKPKAFLEHITKKMEDQDHYYGYGINRVVHCEVVVRSDLTTRFLNAQKKLRQKLEHQPVEKLRKSVPYELGRRSGSSAKVKEELIDYLCKPRLTFHGTQASSVSSIVQHGFLKPGSVNPKTGAPVPIRCGSTYGQGIYTSPDPFFSLVYATPENGTSGSVRAILGAKLIVCLTLMGRSAHVTRNDEWYFQDEPMLDADSHVGNNQLEYIVFDSAYVLPCYVVHLDWGAKRTQEMIANSLEREKMARRAQRRAELRERRRLEADTPGDKKRAKEEKLAQARKFFAYGFGPVSGDKIIIEDIADTDDDEEDYGVYQLQRIDAKNQQKSIWDWDYELGGATDMDQYRDERRQKAKRISAFK